MPSGNVSNSVRYPSSESRLGCSVETTTLHPRNGGLHQEKKLIECGTHCIDSPFRPTEGLWQRLATAVSVGPPAVVAALRLNPGSRAGPSGTLHCDTGDRD